MSEIQLRLRRSAACLTLAVVAYPQMAAAQDRYSLTGADMIAVQTCKDIAVRPVDPQHPDVLISEGPLKGTWGEVPTMRFAFFVASYAGETLEEGRAQARLRGLSSLARKEHLALGTTLEHVQMQIASGNFGSLAAFNANNQPLTSADVENRIDRPWSVSPEVTLRCKLPVERPPSEGGKLDLNLRGTVEALSLAGDDRKSAAAATIGFNRVRSYLDDGSRKETTSYAIKGVLGVALSDNLTTYAGYELKRDRIIPPPVLAPPATPRDGDTETVKFGVLASQRIVLGSDSNRYSNSVGLQIDAGYLIDLVKESERLRGRVSANFYSGSSFPGFCTVGGYKDFGNGLWSRCELEAIATFDVLTRQGTAAPSAKDHFAHIGGRAKLAFYRGNPLDNAAFATAEALYLRRIDGDPATIRQIRRHSFNIGYRWWQNDEFALEIKAELIDGINPDSFADENSLSVGFGVIF